MNLLKAIFRSFATFDPFGNVDISILYEHDDIAAIRKDFKAAGEDMYKYISCKYNGDWRCENPYGNCINLNDAKIKWKGGVK